MHMYTHKKSLSNLRAIFQKAEEVASELPYPIISKDFVSPSHLYGEGLRLRSSEVNLSYCYRTPLVLFKNQDLTMLETAGSNFKAKTTLQKNIGMGES